MRKDIQKYVSQLRVRGEFLKALGVIYDVVNRFGLTAEIFSEYLKILVLRGEIEKAGDEYRRFVLSHGSENFMRYCDLSFLLRLKLLGIIDMEFEEKFWEKKELSDWINTYIKKKEDKIFLPYIKGISMNILEESHITYNLFLSCPSCSGIYVRKYNFTLLISDSFFCHLCFARQKLEFDYIYESLLKKYEKEYERMDIGKVDEFILREIFLELTKEDVGREIFYDFELWVGDLMMKSILRKIAMEEEGNIRSK